MLCNWDIVNAYVLKTGNDLARFYQDVLKNGRPTDVTLETKQPLDERLKAIFGTIPQNKQFMYDVCSKMLNEIDQNRPKASEILNSNSFKTLQDQYLIMNASKWVKTQPVSITQSINMCHNYSKEMLSIAKMRIMNSFGFSKVASNFCEFFGFKNFVSVQQSNMPMRLTSSSPSQNEELDEQQRRNAGLPQNSLGSSMEIEQELGEGTNFVLQGTLSFRMHDYYRRKTAKNISRRKYRSSNQLLNYLVYLNLLEINNFEFIHIKQINQNQLRTRKLISMF